MFDKQKMKELEYRSHNRGLLSKEFYSNQQQDVERKRQQMKAELDQQVEERRRQKEIEKLDNDRRIRKEEEEIKMYYRNLQNREKKISVNESNNMQGSNMKMANQPYQTYPVESQVESRYKNILQQKQKPQSKTYLNADGDIPLMPVMQSQYNQSLNMQQQPSSILSISKQSFQNLGNMPLLDLGQETNNNIKLKQKKTKLTKRQKTLQNEKSRQINNTNNPLSNNQINNIPTHNQPVFINSKDERKSTTIDEESIFGSNVHNKQSEKRNTEIDEEIQEYQQENRSLKNQLKKNQDALTLLIGAVRSNGKFDKYRNQAQKILHGGNFELQQHQQRRQQQQKQEQKLMLPKITIRHQSIMHDYLINAARRGKKNH